MDWELLWATPVIVVYMSAGRCPISCLRDHFTNGTMLCKFKFCYLCVRQLGKGVSRITEVRIIYMQRLGNTVRVYNGAPKLSGSTSLCPKTLYFVKPVLQLSWWPTKSTVMLPSACHTDHVEIQPRHYTRSVCDIPQVITWINALFHNLDGIRIQCWTFTAYLLLLHGNSRVLVQQRP